MKSPSLQKVIEKARVSKRYLYLLNAGVARLVPFNKPHKFRIESITENDIEVSLPNIRRNRNHIKGIHACALATLCELSSGLLLLSRLDISKFRIIMKKMEMEYFYQAKTKVTTSFVLKEEVFEQIKSVAQSEPYHFKAEVDVFDADANKVCTGAVTWQIKSWELVKTKV
jgi:acyl-coenzyme A thioesterase PaaI-like protein